MVVAIPVEHAVPAGEEPRLGRALGVESDEFEPAAVEISDEGEVVGFGHRVVDCNVQLVIDFGADCGVVGVRRFGVEGRQGDPAARDHGRAGGVKHVAANRADVEVGAQQIGRAVGVDNLLAGEQLRHRDAEHLSQRLNERNIGEALARFP